MSLVSRMSRADGFVCGHLVVIFATLCFAGGCKDREYVETHTSPDGTMELVASVEWEKGSPGFLCVKFEIRDAAGGVIFSDRTRASHRMRWEMGWVGNDKVFLESSDIGTYYWHRRNGRWMYRECKYECSLCLAIVQRDYGGCKVGLENGALTDVFCKNGLPLLYVAAAEGGGEYAKLFIEYDADANIRDEDGNTVLHLAIENGVPPENMLPVIEVMDVGIENDRGETALETAERVGAGEYIGVIKIPGDGDDGGESWVSGAAEG